VSSDAPDRFAVGSVLLLRNGERTLTVRTMRTHRDRTIVSFEEVDDRNVAEALTGAELLIEASDARPLDESEYWDHDLIGCKVVTTDGATVGEVIDVLHGGANEVIVVRGPDKEHLVPLVSDIVRRVEPGERVTIEPIPGLLE
jgi:16S rRNA processing protein RimM